jgi:uncharacterized membrane protein
MSIRNKKAIIYLTIICFGIIFCLISLVNHYNYRTFAWDLGINNNAIFDYAHFRWNDCMLLQPQYKNVLGDHFTLYPIIVSPLFWIFGTYTMLIFQIFAIILGGIGIQKYITYKSDSDSSLPLLALIHFFSIWGIYSALAFDYHDNVISAMLIPWFFYYFEKGNFKASVFLIVLVCIGKENMALWMTFICLGLILLNIKDRPKLKAAIMGFVFSIVYFLVVVKFVIPSMANTEKGYNHFNYTLLGSNFSEAFTTILTRPLYVIKALFVNQLSNPEADGIKFELHKFVLISGGVFLLLKPQYLIMLIPIYAQKLFNDDFSKWGINSHYSIEFVPIICICLFNWILGLKKHKILAASAFCILTLASTLSSLDHRVSKWYSREQSNFYSKEHYITKYDVNDVKKALSIIPKSASVSATNSLVPHLAFREYIYQFPDGENQVDYIAILNSDNYYPLSEKDMDLKKEMLMNSGKWKILYKSDSIIILSKI